MRKSTPILLSVIVLLIVSLACSLSSAPAQDINALGTAVMQTMISGAQTARGIIPVDLVDTPTASQTFTPVFTPTPAGTLTPSPVFTFTSVVPQVSINIFLLRKSG